VTTTEIPRVPGAGPIPCDVCFISDFPASEELRRMEPLVGRAGREFTRYLNGYTIPRTRREVYLTNLSKQFAPDTAHFQFDEEDETLLWEELRRVRPKLIVTMGMHATRYFLGRDTTLEMTHGLPHAPADIGPFGELEGVTILPAFNPGAALYSPKAQAEFAYDMRQVGLWLRDQSPPRPTDQRGRERYTLLEGEELECVIARWLNVS
jgi:DNA polymerase